MPRLHHAGMTVGDLDGAVAFYTEVLGCVLVERIEPDDPAAVRSLVGVPDALISGCLLELSSGQRIELLSYRSGHQRHLDQRPCDRPSTHLACTVDDLRAATDAVLRSGGTVVGRPVRFGAGTFLYCSDPDGNFLELIEEAS
ncbi:VOC family protein [Amycolatopsis magusensis]|uniref:VOC family protein n=1 Tax=Amycolatopsis magusensis TaxID=882444 RepID=UPI0037A0B92D